MPLPQRSLPQQAQNDLWLKLPWRANRCITEVMYNLPNLLVVSSTYSTHFSDSVCGSPSVRPTLRHCIRIWLNKPINVLRLFGILNKKEQNVCSWLRNVPCSKTVFLVIRFRIRTITVLCKVFFQNSLGKVFKLLNIYLKTFLY